MTGFLILPCIRMAEKPLMVMQFPYDFFLQKIPQENKLENGQAVVTLIPLYN